MFFKHALGRSLDETHIGVRPPYDFLTSETDASISIEILFICTRTDHIGVRHP